MNFRIADSFSASLARLPAQAQKAVKITSYDLQTDPSRPGLSFHRVDRARDPDFWTVRVNADIRIVVHKRGEDMLLAYVDHHDKAYAWAERRRLEVHPKTGAAQIVEIRERVEEIVVPKLVEQEVRKPAIIGDVDDETLLACGVPEDWLEDVRSADEDSILDIADHLPAEAAEAVLNLAVGQPPPAPQPEAIADPFSHPDARRRFRSMENRAELEAALEAPWEAWTVFLHPSQRDFVEREFNGPARVTGSAGTGKTVVAIHRAARMARRHPEAKVLLTTFTEALATALRVKLRRLIGGEPEVMRRITVRHLEGLAADLHEERVAPFEIASDRQVTDALAEAAAHVGAPFSEEFLLDEWLHVVDAWNIRTSESYASVPRLGRKTRVGGRQRDVLWDVMSRAREKLSDRGLMTWSALFEALRESVSAEPPFDFIVVDEAQDLRVAELQFLAAMAKSPNTLFFAGDIGQRIFRQPFSWKKLDVDIRGRSRILKVNYRTSHQIRSRADRLLPTQLSDVDGNEESRTGVVSVFGGPDPEVLIVAGEDAEIRAVADWISERLEEGFAPGEVGVVVRTAEQIDRAKAAVEHAGASAQVLTGSIEPSTDSVSICTMHVAKGLEFRAVAVMACDEDVVPLAERLESAATESELTEAYETERHLLYVACTRARERLLASGVAPGSEYLEDLQ